MAKYKLKDMYSRRPKFQDKEELEDRIDLFYDMCECLNMPVTYTGLMLVLGLNNKNQLSSLRYHQEYGELVSAAIASVEFFYESKLSEGKPVGAIFALKNFGWSDRTDVAIADSDPQKVAMKEAQLAVLNTARKAMQAVAESTVTKFQEIDFAENEDDN